MSEPRFNQNVELLARAKWPLTLGAIGCILGVLLNLLRILFDNGILPYEEGLIDWGLEALNIGMYLGIAFGFFGYSGLYDEKVCAAVGTIKLILLADYYLFGIAMELGYTINIIIGVVVVLLEVTAMVMLFIKPAKFRFVFLGVAALIVIFYGLGWITRDLNPNVGLVRAILDLLMLTGLFGFGAFVAWTLPPEAYGGGQDATGGGYPPAGDGGYPPTGGGYPPAGDGGYPPAGGGYPPAGGGGYPPAGGGGYPPAGGGGYPPAGGGYTPQG
jgi:hypothetical protein